MLIFPAIDLYGGEAVRLFKGDYAQKTVYSADPVGVAQDFAAQGAKCVHLVDLEGARIGLAPNFDIICRIKAVSGLFCEVGGGIRSVETIEKYVNAGIDRVILGTAAVTESGLVEKAYERYSDRIAVGIDIRDGRVAIKGWTENSGIGAFDFCKKIREIGVKTIICTDISRDGAMQGTNISLYKTLSESFDMDIIASGGVSSMEDVRALREMDLYGAIIGKAYYTGAISLKEAIEVAR